MLFTSKDDALSTCDYLSRTTAVRFVVVTEKVRDVSNEIFLVYRVKAAQEQ